MFYICFCFGIYICFCFGILLYFPTFASKTFCVHIPVNLKQIAHRAKFSATGWKQMTVCYLFQGKHHSFNNYCSVVISYSVCINRFVYYLFAKFENNLEGFMVVYTIILQLNIQKKNKLLKNLQHLILHF